MERMDHEQQHAEYPEGTVVVALNGQQLGTVRTVYAHYLLVQQPNNPHADLRVPPHAIANYDGDRLQLSINREALSVVDVEETAEHPLHNANT